MSDAVRTSYDRNAERYASHVLKELDADDRLGTRLAAFAALAGERDGVVADLGCGPGHITNRLCELGLDAVGFDLSPGQIEQALQAFPHRQFHVGDLTALEHDDSSLGGIVSRHSLIHLPPTELGDVFAGWFSALALGAPVFVSFFGARSAGDHGIAFDHKIVTAYALWRETVAQLLLDAGFVDVDIESIPMPEGGRPFDDVTLIAVKPKL